MATVDAKFVYGLDKFEFVSKTLGYISEEGLAWGGDKPEKVKINAAQVKSAPVKIITKNSGTNVITFKLIELDADNCVKVMGGSAAAGLYTPDANQVDLTGKAVITCSSGHVITIAKASLSAKFTGNINGSEVLAIECELEVLAPDEEGVAPYTIAAPAAADPQP